MSIKQYPKHQFIVEVDGQSNLLHFIPSFSGYVKNIRVKMIKRNYPDCAGSAVINILANAREEAGNEKIVATSSIVYYNDIANAPNAADYYHAFVRFDFGENLLLSGKEYTLSIVQSDYIPLEDSFVGYCLDYDYPVNQTSGSNSALNNMRLAAEIYLLRDYYEFD